MICQKELSKEIISNQLENYHRHRENQVNETSLLL